MIRAVGGDRGGLLAAFEEGHESADIDQNGGVEGGDLALFLQWSESGFAGDHTLDAQRFLYRGYHWDDALKMYHVRHRVYDPARMLWIQRDPLGRVPGANEYAYCLGEPIDFYDPMGLDGWWLGSLARDAGLVELGEYLDDTVDGGAELVSYWKEMPSPSQILEDASDPEARQDVHDALRQAEDVANQIPGGQLAAGGVRVADSLLTVFDAYVDGDRAQTPQVYILGVGNVSTGSPVGDAVLNVFVTLAESSSQASGKGGGNKRSDGGCSSQIQQADKIRKRDPKTGRLVSDPDNPPSPYRMTDADRRKHWRRIANDPESRLDDAQRDELKKRGYRGPQRVGQDGDIETMELHHHPVPLREGGKKVVPLWPNEHDDVDPHRKTKNK